MDNIDNMPAGREMDQLIAEKVMGLDIVLPKTDSLEIRVKPVGENRKWIECLPLRPYSTDISAAWDVVNLFRYGLQPQPNKDAVACVIEMIVTDYCGREDCVCTIYSPSLAKVQATAGQMPLAICRAALKVVMESKQK